MALLFHVLAGCRNAIRSEGLLRHHLANQPLHLVDVAVEVVPTELRAGQSGELNGE